MDRLFNTLAKNSGKMTVGLSAVFAVASIKYGLDGDVVSSVFTGLQSVAIAGLAYTFRKMQKMDVALYHAQRQQKKLRLDLRDFCEKRGWTDLISPR